MLKSFIYQKKKQIQNDSCVLFDVRGSYRTVSSTVSIKALKYNFICF